MTEQTAAWGRSSGAGGGVSRPIGFTLSQRLSIELDVTHRPGSSGSIGSLAAQCATADAADGRQLEPLTSPTPSDEQAVIVHKVRLSGPNELESLLFGNATTAFPDTTVARILKPQQLNSSGSGAGFSSLAHSYSWAAPGGLAASGHGCYSTANTASSIRQQQRVNGWTFGGWATAGAQRPAHPAPSRSASVNIALLSRQLHSGGGGGGSCSSSAASSQSHGSLKTAGSRDCLSGAAAGTLPSSSRPAPWEPRRTSLETLPSLAHKAAAAEAAAGAAAGAGWPFRQQQQQQQPLLRATGGVFQQALQLQAGSLPAPIQGNGRVSKARSYQALSALQAAGSAELCDSLAAAAAQAAATHKAAARGVVAAAASADAVSMLNSRSSGDGGLYPRAQQQMHFRPAFRSAVHSTSKGAPFALQQRFSDSAALAGQQQHRPAWSLPAPGDAAAAAQSDSQQQQQQQQGSPSILAQAASLADSLTWDSSSDHELPEGKVRGGLARSRSSSLQTLTMAMAFAEAGAAATQAAARALSATPAAAAATAQPEADQDQSSLGTKGDSLEGEAAAGATGAYGKEGQADSSTQPQGLEASLRAAAADNSQLQDQYNSSSSSSSSGRQVLGKEPSEQCVRGGHTKASRLQHSASSPELVSLTAARASGRTSRRASLVLPPTGIPPLSSSSSSSATLNASLQQPVPRDGSMWGSSSLPRVVQNSNALSITAEGGGSDSFTAAVSPFAADITGRSPSLASLLLDVQQLQQQQAGGLVGVSAFAGAAALSPQGSRELTEGSYGADGAVHGGELGEQALEGQMHGGRRSKSLVSLCFE